MFSKDMFFFQKKKQKKKKKCEIWVFLYWLPGTILLTISCGIYCYKTIEYGFEREGMEYQDPLFNERRWRLYKINPNNRFFINSSQYKHSLQRFKQIEQE